MRIPSFFTLLIAIFMIMAWPVTAQAACSNPVGEEGQIIYNGTYGVPAYCDNTNWIAMAGADPRSGGGDYIPNAVEFDGTNDYLINGAGLSGVTDSKKITASFWVQPGIGGQYQIFDTSNNKIDISIVWSELRLSAKNDASTSILAFRSPGLTISVGKWCHVLFSVDLSNPGKRHVYVNDSPVASGWNTYVDDLIDFTIGNVLVGDNAAFIYNGNIADFWMETDAYIDLSIEANRRKFIKANGNPAYLGENGELPTGSAPDIFLSGDTVDWHTNKGTGGGFTENGALSTAASTPYIQYTDVVPSGLVGHWRLDETSGTTAYDSSGNGNDGTMLNTMDGSSDSVVGKVNKALYFDGITGGSPWADRNSIEIALTDGNGTETFSVWVYQQTRSSGVSPDLRDYIVTKGIDRTKGSFILNIDASGQFEARTNYNTIHDGAYYCISDATIPLNTWTHLVAVKDTIADELTIYINGKIEKTCPAGGEIFEDDIGNVYIGWLDSVSGKQWRYYFHGYIDDVRYYHRALSPEEVTAIYEARDGIRYNGDHRVMEYFDGNRWVSMTPSWPEVDEGPVYGSYPVDASCPNIGDVCSNGSVYAGLSPDGNAPGGNAPMYTTPADAPTQMPWGWDDGIDSGYTETSMEYCDSPSSPLISSCWTGAANTQILVTEDSKSGVGGIQPHIAAEYCSNLSAHGYQDWYLPAADELAVLYTNHVAIGAFDTGVGSFYWASSERNSANGRTQNFNNGNETFSRKAYNQNVRCVRKNQAPITGTGGLVGHWKLDETSGTTAADSSGNGNDGIMQNGQDATNDSTFGAVGTAISFDGVDDIIQVSDPGANSVLDFDVGQTITLSAWIKPENVSGNKFILVKGASPSTENYRFDINGSTLRAIMRADGTYHQYQSTGIVQAQEWQHVAFVYTMGNGSSAQLYHNGVAVSGSWSGGGNFTAVLLHDMSLKIGSWGFGNYFLGGIDDVRIYDRILSADEIAKLYQMGAPVGSSTALPQGCPNIGDVCDDGTIYAGLSPDGNVEMFTTWESLGPMPWNNGNSSNKVAVGASSDSGATNTSLIVSTDADSGTVGFQPHQAAQACYDLTSNGADDWYLPSDAELGEIMNNYSILNMPISGGVQTQLHWASNEHTVGSTARGRGFYPSAPLAGNANYEFNRNVRCVRKGPAPRCANPYGVEGAMFYNTTHDVMQYCDGARWIAIGKSN